MHLLAGHMLTVLERGFEEMCHPPYSPDQTPNDYHMFPNLKKYRQRFLPDDELKCAAKEWLKRQSELHWKLVITQSWGSSDQSAL